MNSGPDLLIDRIDRWAHERSQNRAILFVEDDRESGALSYLELYSRACALANHLVGTTEFGDRVLLVFPSGLDFVVAYLGCLMSGRVAVPVVAPRKKRYAGKFTAIRDDCKPSLALTTRSQRAKIDTWLHTTEDFEIPCFCVDELETVDRVFRRFSYPGASDVAMLQYTSGSTGEPKGVVVTHGNLAANENSICRAFEHDSSTVFASWLPLFHDMGLVGNLLQPLYLGVSTILMSPSDFLMRPVRWLRMISEYRATTSGGPNFSYDLCARKITEAQMAGLDLSSWSVAYCGAEPVRSETMERFNERFSAYGFRRKAFYPCYGLAEATLFVAGVKKGSPTVYSVDQESLLQDDVRLTSGSDGVRLVSCGLTHADDHIEIVEPETRQIQPEGTIGEIWIAGPSVAMGYWKNEKNTQESFRARIVGRSCNYLRTGDLGCRIDNDLVVTGRIKDLIIVRGKNHYAHDLERTVESVRSIEKSRSTAFAVDIKQEERVVIVCELALRDRHAFDSIARTRAKEEIRLLLGESHGIVPYEILILQPRSVATTSSGKVRRLEMKKRYLNGELLEIIKTKSGDAMSVDLPALRDPTIQVNQEDCVI